MRQLCGFLGGSYGGHRDKKKMVLRRQVQTVELRVRMDCQRCESEVKKALSGLRGVQHVEVNRPLQKVTVTGEVDSHAVLRRAQSTGKKAEPWPPNPVINAPAAVALYGLGAAHVQAHDGRWAPATAFYPRSVEAAAIGAEQFTNMFSEDNPNACSVM